MPSANTRNTELKFKIWAARLAGGLIALGLLLAVCVMLLKNAAGCAFKLGDTPFEDDYDNAPAPSALITQNPRAFADSAYDAVYPDLIEYSEATPEEAQ